MMAILFLWMGPVTECPPSVLAQRIGHNANPWGFQGAPLVAGRLSEKGRQGAQRTLPPTCRAISFFIKGVRNEDKILFIFNFFVCSFDQY